MNRTAWLWLALLLSSAFVACSGKATLPGSSGTAPNAAAPDVRIRSGRHGTVKFIISVPHRHHRRAHFVSPATQSMTVNVKLGGLTVNGFPATVNLTLGSIGCTSTLASTLCTLAVNLPPANGYVASVATYDGTNAAGNVLSQGQSVAFDVVIGKGNTVALTLDGIPASIAVSAGAAAIRGSQNAGFTIYGTTAQPLIVNALDADGNAIVGAGSPTYSASVVGGTWSTPATPSPTSPNKIPIAPPGTNGSGAVLQIAAAYSDGSGTCSLPAAVCTTTVSLKNVVQQLFVANFNNGGGNGNVMVYSPPFSSASTPSGGDNGDNPNAYVLATNGHYLFVGNGFSTNAVSVSLFSNLPGTATVLQSGLNVPHSLAFDSFGNLIVANRGGGSLFSYTLTPLPGGTPNATATTGVNTPYQVLADSSGNIFSANEGANTVTEYAAPLSNSSSPTATISTGVSSPYAIAFDPAGDLFVANWGPGTGSVTEYAPPFSNGSTPIATISSGINLPNALAVDGTGRLFVVNASTVTIYAPPYTGSPVTVSSGITSPYTLALDGAGNLFVANSTPLPGSVTEYAPPYIGAPVATITNGMKGPEFLLFVP